jgi:tetratricopeptide (TPR) repeat protein
MQGLASVLRRRGRPAEAETLLREAITLLMPTRSRHDQAAAFALLRLAELLAVDREDRAAAEVVTRQAVAVAREDLGPDHPQLAWGLNDLAVLVAQGGAFEEGLALAREAAAMMARIYGPTHRAAIRIISAEARVHLLAGRPEVAESLWRVDAQYFARIEGPGATIGGIGGIARALEAQGRYLEADSLRQQLVDFRRNTSGPHHLLTAIETGHLAWLRHLEGNDPEAERLFLGAITDLEAHTAPGHYDVRRLHRQLAEVYAATGRDAEAEHHRDLSRPG